MKMRALFAAFVTVMLFALMSCKSGPKDLITKKWKATDVTAPGITPERKADFLAEDLALEFMKDGKYKAFSKGKEDDNGTYTLSEDAKTLTINSSKSGSVPIPVSELTKDKMVANLMGADVTFTPEK